MISESKRAYNKRYYAVHKEAILESNKAYRVSHREALLEYDKERYPMRRNVVLSQKADYYKNHEEERRAYNKKYRIKNCDVLNAKKKQYVQANRKLVNARNYNYISRNRGKQKAWIAKWRSKNPHKAKQYWSERRATLLKAEKDIESVRQFYLSIEFQDVLSCSYCSKFITRGEVHIDHIIALSRGGRHAADNLAVACGPCNLSKNDLLLSEWPKCPERLKTLGMT